MKFLVILIDGIGDTSDGTGLTPLEKANVPNMDYLASRGMTGLMDPVSPGKACGSDTAHLSLLGYDPLIYYRGRGAFEAMGAGLQMECNDVAFKSNFSCLDEDSRIVTSRRADRDFTKEGPILCKYLDGMKIPGFEDVKVSLLYATEHRCAVKIGGNNFSDQISGTDPLKCGLPLRECIPFKVDDADANYTCNVVNSLSKEITRLLNGHPINLARKKEGKPMANCILLRGAGTKLKVPSFQQKYGWKGFMVAPTCIISGLGMSIGLDVIKVQGATGDYHSDIMAKGKAALENMANYDFGFVHIKAVDDAGHDKRMDLKIHFLEKIDEMIGYIISNAKDNIVICVTGDHSTPVLYGDHSCEPVPFLVSRLGFDDFASDKVSKFDECSVAEGCLGRFPGMEMMPLLKKIENYK